MKANIYFKTKWKIKDLYNLSRTKLIRDNIKIFGIGLNKTGTTSLKYAMKELGFIIGNQRTAELLFDDWTNRDFNRIKNYCKTAQFFQDVPFSLPDTYKELDIQFPGSKFILTIRDNPDQWYESITRFHAKLWGKNGRIPTKGDLQEAIYLYKGRPWVTNQSIFKTPENDPYNKEILIKFYMNYNREVQEYFEYGENDLLILNVSNKDAVQKLASFVDRNTSTDQFPWINKT